MKKKKLRNILLSLVLTPFFALSITGCWKATTDNTLSKSKQNKAYSILRDFYEKDNFLIDKNSNSIKVNFLGNYTETTDWSNSNIPEDKREDIANNKLYIPLDSETEDYVREEELGYNYIDNTGYYVEKTTTNDKDENNNRLETESFRVSNMEIIKKSSNEYLKYDYYYNDYYKDDKNIYRVDDKYAINTYRNMAFSYLTDEFSQPITQYIIKNKTLDSFKENLKELSNDIINYEIDILDKTLLKNTTTLDITLADGIYSLTLITNIKNCKIEDWQFEDGILADLYTKTTIMFNDDSIKSLNHEVEYFKYKIFNCNEHLDNYLEDITFNNNHNISVTESQNYSITCDLINNFNESIINQDVTEYTGTGTNNEIENIRAELYVEYVDFENIGEGISGYRFGDLLNLDNNSTHDFRSDYTTKIYYWDKECTKPVLSTDTAPSYETTFYIKLNVADGYAAATGISYYENGGSGWSSAYSQVINISTEKYIIPSWITNYNNINKVYVNGIEITDFANGITFNQSGCFYIEFYLSDKD